MKSVEKFVLKKGCLIVFEGIDGTGKSTQLQLLADQLQAKGIPVVTTREPTEGFYGQKIRALYTNRQQITKKEELQLFIQDRKDHVDNLIHPALVEKKVVLCDRYYLSTMAYQGAAGMDPKIIFEMNSFAPDPDLALLFRLDPVLSVQRITGKRGDTLNDFEQLESLKKVSRIFESMNFPFIHRVEAEQSVNDVHKKVMEVTMSCLNEFMVGK